MITMCTRKNTCVFPFSGSSPHHRCPLRGRHRQPQHRKSALTNSPPLHPWLHHGCARKQRDDIRQCSHCGGSVCALGLSELGQMDRGWKGGRSSPGCCRLHNRGLLPDRVPELLCCSRSEVSFNPRNGSGSSCKFASGTMLSCGSAKLCHLLLE